MLRKTQTTNDQKQCLDANSSHDKALCVFEAAARQAACWRGFSRRQVAADRQIQRNRKRMFAAAPRLASREATTDARTAAQRMPRTVCASACGGRSFKENRAAAFRSKHTVAVSTRLVPASTAWPAAFWPSARAFCRCRWQRRTKSQRASSGSRTCPPLAACWPSYATTPYATTSCWCTQTAPDERMVLQWLCQEAARGRRMRLTLSVVWQQWIHESPPWSVDLMMLPDESRHVQSLFMAGHRAELCLRSVEAALKWAKRPWAAAVLGPCPRCQTPLRKRMCLVTTRLCARCSLAVAIAG